MNKILLIKLFLLCVLVAIVTSCAIKKGYTTQQEELNKGKFQFDQIAVKKIEEIEKLC